MIFVRDTHLFLGNLSLNSLRFNYDYFSFEKWDCFLEMFHLFFEWFLEVVEWLWSVVNSLAAR